MTRLSDAEIEEIVECLQYAEDGRAADVIRQLQADLAAMTAERDALRAELSEANRKLGGGCEANNGEEHLVITQGRYKFCGNCGESLQGVRFVHLPRPINKETAT